MASSLSEKTIKPTDELLSSVLAGSKQLWDEIIRHIASTYKKPVEEWKFYGAKSGWTLAVLSDKRRLINMIPQSGYFQAMFTLSEKAAAVAQDSDLPEAVKALIPTQTQCVCGYGITLNIKTAADVEDVKKLLEIKDKN